MNVLTIVSLVVENFALARKNGHVFSGDTETKKFSTYEKSSHTIKKVLAYRSLGIPSSNGSPPNAETDYKYKIRTAINYPVSIMCRLNTSRKVLFTAWKSKSGLKLPAAVIRSLEFCHFLER